VELLNAGPVGIRLVVAELLLQLLQLTRMTKNRQKQEENQITNKRNIVLT
jgi:hypothetical protein